MLQSKGRVNWSGAYAYTDFGTETHAIRDGKQQDNPVCGMGISCLQRRVGSLSWGNFNL